MGMAKKVTGYSSAQIALHWIVVGLVAFQFLAHDAIETTWRAFQDSEPPPEDARALTYMHIAAGILVLLLALVRIYLRIVRGAPSPPSDEPRLLQVLAEAVHGSIYVLLLLLPITGAVAWFIGMQSAASVHGLLKTVLLGAIVLHVAGGLFQHFIRRSDVLMRMFRPEGRTTLGEDVAPGQ